MERMTKSGAAHDEFPIGTANGFLALVVALLLLVAGGLLIANSISSYGVRWGLFASGIVLLIVAVLTLAGLYTLQPNEAAIIQLFGAYRGTSRVPGLRATNPFYSRKKMSLRARNLNGERLKVNDKRGNPIEIAAVVVWRVVDSAEAVFEVDDYKNFVQVQTEAAVRNLATSYPYDAHVDGEIALRSHTTEVAERLKVEIQDRLAKAGVAVIEARISHLAYAPEIAGAMLRRQQASAIVAARTRIVEGAVGMVEMALDELARKHVVELDSERKAAMVSNLLVVLCSDQHTQPVVNTGTLYT
jgi:regulator of protease activity HflC (stomatin/prohibitin superfamily)